MARKRVRSQVAYAQRTKRLSHGNVIDAGEFFRWADTKWPRISIGAIHPPEPVTIHVKSQAQSGYVTAGQPFVIVSPSNHEELGKAYIDVVKKFRKLKGEHAKLVDEISALRSRLAERAERDAKISRDRTEAGRKGGQVRRLGKQKP